MIRKLFKGTLVGSLALAVMAGPALATGSQSWGPQSFTGKYTTPNYSTSNSGTHRINSLVTVCGRNTSYTDRLVRVRPFLPDIFYSYKSGTCGSWVSRSWSAAAINYDTGTFHYDVEKTGSGTAQGNNSWP